MSKEIYNYQVNIRFYEELNFFLPKEKQKIDFIIKFKTRRSIKDLIESCGVPHVEVDLILVNGISVPFTYIVKNHDRISVYPVFERLDITNVSRLRPTALRNVKFVLDVHLNKLARKLRLLGFDVDYSKYRNDVILAKISEDENRILLTRDSQLLMRKNITHGLYVRNILAEKQTIEIITRLQLWDLIRPFTRCINCNGLLTKLSCNSENFLKLKHKIPPKVLDWCKKYHICNKCQNIYWEGTIFKNLKSFVNRVISSENNKNTY